MIVAFRFLQRGTLKVEKAVQIVLCYHGYWCITQNKQENEFEM